MARLFELEPVRPDYEQDRSQSVASRAVAAGVEPYEYVIDLLCKHGGKNLLVYPHENMYDGDLENVRTMLSSEYVVCGESDAGAHAGQQADHGMPTYLLTHWARDRTRGPQLPIELVVQKQTSLTAQAYGLHDRGVLKPGYKADINVIDFERLSVLAPRATYDLPTGGRRLLQGAQGYQHTFVGGVETWRDGVETGARPGRLVRGAQQVPSMAEAVPTSVVAAPASAASRRGGSLNAKL
jgi:N-acyl-D-aspartate/D-glutamate deacylase